MTRRQVAAAAHAYRYGPSQGNGDAFALLMSTIDAYVAHEMEERAERLLARTGFYKRAEEACRTD